MTVQEEFEEETDWSMGLPSKETRIDFRKAQEFGLPPPLISDQLYYGLHGGFTDEFCRLPNIRQGTPLVRYEPEQRRDNETDLNQASPVNAQGATVPLKSFANATDRAASTVVIHDGMRRVITVLGYYRPDGPPSLDLSMELIRKAGAGISWPLGYGLEMRGDMTQMMDSFRRLFWGLGLSVIFIYMMQVAQFGGWLQPLQMILSGPLELTGAFLGLLIMTRPSPRSPSCRSSC